MSQDDYRTETLLREHATKLDGKASTGSCSYNRQDPNWRLCWALRNAANELEEMRAALEKFHGLFPTLHEIDEVLHPRKDRWICIDESE